MTETITLRPWKRAIALACLVVYGPFVATALYAQAFVDCSHCKQTAWMTIPAGPGYLSLLLLRNVWSFKLPGNAAIITLVTLYSLALTLAVARLARANSILRKVGMVLVLIYSALCAVGMLLAIRA
ncbi:MAG TPA: hypothetical protein VMF06_15375 [Candidatus Limnocylindria bacterium]|nr:hypothetical protein [Candidatus Limnocylindria bacterium]